MAAPTEGKASSGSPFRPPPAVIWNNMIEAGRAWADGRLSNESPPPTRPRETDIIKVRNDSGAARRNGEILRIEGSALTDVVDEHIWLLGIEPTAEGYFGILKRPCETSAVESLQVSGCCIALVDIQDVDHRRAAAVDGEYVLESSDRGPIEILYAPDGTGEQTCVVRFSAEPGAIELIDALVIECYGEGFYLVELADMPDMTVPDVADCDPCTGDCNAPTTSFPRTLPIGRGVYVTAYDSRKIPMETGGHCVIGNMGDQEIGGGGQSGDNIVYRVIVPARAIESFNVEDWECCPTGIQLTSCETYYGELVRCPAVTTPCP